MQKISVNLAERSYDISIGRNILAALSDFLREAKFRRALVVTDENVAKFHAGAVLDVAQKAGLEAECFVIPPGEASKTLNTAFPVYTRAIETGLDRRSPIIALGGGVVGDLAGFVAATYLRGVPLLQIPTTLLADVDSGVGGKTAVNHPLGKNLIGAFYQPQGVFIDLDFLATLPTREISTGLGEIVKYGAICDEKFFAYLEENAALALKLDDAVTTRMIARSCEIKAEVVSGDEKEADRRRILNFGHTVGHAVEQETGYARYNHGEAVSVGMVAAAWLSVRLGTLAESDFCRLKNLLQALNLPLKAENCDPKNIYAELFHDKKTVQGKIHWVLLNGIGQTTIRNDVPQELVMDAIKEVLNN